MRSFVVDEDDVSLSDAQAYYGNIHRRLINWGGRRRRW